MQQSERLYRDFFWLFVRRDFSVRYAGSTLGALWNLIHPLVMIGIYMMIFSSLMRWRMGSAAGGRADYGELVYGVHLCAGLIPWLLFQDVLSRSVHVLHENSNFLQKVSFPPIVLFNAVLFNAMLIYGAGWTAFLLILTALGYHPPVSALGVLPLMLALGLAAMGLGLVLAGLNVFFRDTGQILAVALQVLFWLNPIVYFKESIPAFDPATPVENLSAIERLGRGLIAMNPVARFVEASQWLVGQAPYPPSAADWAVMAGFTAAALVLGGTLFRRMLPDARDAL